MQAYVTLVRRELGCYLLSLNGYVIIASVLLLLGLGFVDMLVKLNGEPADAPLTEWFFRSVYFWLILLMTTPVITMRSFAQEKASGTYETLMTAPVSDLQVVLAKFTGTLVFYWLTWLPLLGCMVILRYYTGESVLLEPRQAASTYLGLTLVGSLYMAMGCFASALTRSQILAAIVSFVLGLTLFIIGLRSLVATPANDWTDRFFAYLSLIEHVEEFSRGVVDTRYLVFYGSLTFFFLFLTLKVVESRRWK